jgi:ABC-type nitrate/sulfonate/bicarbonate transport system substrate-binding protein
MLLGLVSAWLYEATAQQSTVKPQKSTIEIAIAGFAHTTMPMLIAQEAGYFAKHGLAVNISAVSAAVAMQGLISGRIDIYQGGAAAIAATLQGADIIYGGAGVDKSSLMLFSQKHHHIRGIARQDRGNDLARRLR